jgi:DNA ligase 3
MSDVKFSVDYSKRLSKCKKCKLELAKGDIRLAKLVPNFFGGDEGDMKQYYHINCMFETFQRARATTRKIESADDIEDFQSIKDDDKKLILNCIGARGSSKGKATTSSSPSTKSSSKSTKTVEAKTDTESSSSSDEEDNAKRPKTSQKATVAVEDSDSDDGLKLKDVDCDDNKFETFQKIIEEMANESGRIKKTAILKDFFKNGINGSKKVF